MSILKGFKLGYVSRSHTRYMNCNWINCIAGTGISGSGHCFLRGRWWWKKCPEFVKEEEKYMESNIEIKGSK